MRLTSLALGTLLISGCAASTTPIEPAEGAPPSAADAQASTSMSTAGAMSPSTPARRPKQATESRDALDAPTFANGLRFALRAPPDAARAQPFALAAASSIDDGELLFKTATFTGNGRTCSTCHSDATGTFSPAEARARYLANPRDPLFRPIDSDGGLGLTYTRLLTKGTVRVDIPLPPNMVMLDEPTARSVALFRSTLTTLNSPSLDPVIMWDGRQTNLEDQAFAAFHQHAQITQDPTAQDLADIAAYEKTLFSSDDLRAYAQGGPAPGLPAGITDSEKRGRDFFLPDTFTAPPLIGASKKGICAACHAGPMLDQIGNSFPVASGIPCPVPELGQIGIPCPSLANPPRPPGSRFMTDFVSELNEGLNPVHVWAFLGPDGTIDQNTVQQGPDLGLALITGNKQDAFLFKIPTLRNIKNTAPYFHDNSQLTLADVASHYQRFFTIAFFGRILLTEQDKADIVAYLQLL